MRSHSLEETARFAREFVGKIPAKENGAAVVLLSGDLGSGKTAFVQAAARALGVGDFVTSPTYLIEKVYPLHGRKFDRMVHVDLYRIESERELAHLDWETIVGDPKNLVFVEWPEKAAGLMPKDRLEIRFRFVSENERDIEF